jgi:hypothetical protein
MVKHVRHDATAPQNTRRFSEEGTDAVRSDVFQGPTGMAQIDGLALDGKVVKLNPLVEAVWWYQRKRSTSGRRASSSEDGGNSDARAPLTALAR